MAELTVAVGDNNRSCGTCTLCCKLLPVRELAKPANTKCGHQSRKGCAIYRRLGFPASCAIWNCGWLAGEDLPRPDRAGWVVDIIPDEVRAHNSATGEVVLITVRQVWVEPGVDPTHDPRLRRFAERSAEGNMGLLLRYGSGRAVMVFAPAMASDGQWHIIRDEQITALAPSPSGNLLLDRLKAEREALDAQNGRAGDKEREAGGVDADRLVAPQS